MGLYHKYRPQTFDEMLGNTEVIQTLKDAVANESRSHAYLFTGPSGCGKTTAARIFAKELGVDELSLMEVNSANNRGIDTARGMIDQMKAYPFRGKIWVYIIDEVHMTSKDFQNAMLKPLEDTPAHVYFFLCTTNPEKLIKAIKTRTTEVQFSSLEPKYISRLVRRTAREENIELDPSVAEEIVDVCQGSARGALVALEKVAKLDKDAALKLLRSNNGEIEAEEGKTLDLCRALTRKDRTWGDVCECLKGVYEDESDWEKIRYQVLGYANAILLQGKENPSVALLVECFSEPFYDSGKAGVTLACYQAVTCGK